jgi:hypothetical protein
MTIDATHDALRADEYLKATLLWQRACLDAWTLTQRYHFENLAAAQRAIEAFNQDLFDRWICRFGGGVPLDG